MYVALLRGINVGTAKRVAMADLRAMVEEMGYKDVRTLLNSGNVVFSVAKAAPRDLAHRLEKALAARLGVSARVIVISAKDLAEVVAANPLGKAADNPSRLLTGILRDRADREKLAEIVKKDWGQERIALGPASAAVAAGAEGAAGAAGAAEATCAVYMWMPLGVIQSKLNAAVSKALGDGVTARNWATMLKLKEMTGE
jgi:uncharacterized protein (DUF1697 family)